MSNIATLPNRVAENQTGRLGTARKMPAKQGGGGRVQTAAAQSQKKLQATAGNDQKWEAYTFALTGKTADERTPEENAALKQLRSEILSGEISPEFIQADPPNGDGPNRLPRGARGAFVAGGKGKVLIAPHLRGAQLQKTSDEEQGEAVAARAKELGIGVADGDAGGRTSGVVNGKVVTHETAPDLFEDHASDTINVVLDGQVVQAEADAGPQTQTIEIWFKKDAKDDTQVEYYHKGEWHIAKTKSDGDEESGYVTAEIPADVTPDQIRVYNSSEDVPIENNSTNVKRVENTQGTDLHFEDRPDGGDGSFDDVNIRMKDQPAPATLSGNDGVVYDLSTAEGQQAYLASFDGSDGTQPDGMLSIAELEKAGVPPEKASRLAKLYGVGEKRGEFKIPLEDPQHGSLTLDGVGIDDMVADGTLVATKTGTGEYHVAVDFARVSGETSANAMVRSEAARRREDGDTRPMAQIIWDVEVNGMTAQQMDWATDDVFGDKDPMNSDNKNAKKVADNFGIPFRVEGSPDPERRMTKASLEAAFSNGAITIKGDGGHFIGIAVNTEVRAPGEFFDEEMMSPYEIDIRDQALPPNEGHLHLSFTTDEPQTVYATIQEPDGTVKQVKVYTHKPGGPKTAHIDVPLEPGQTVQEIWVGGPNGERRPSQPGPGQSAPSWATQPNADGTVTQYYETSDGSRGADYTDVIINWAPPGTTYRRHATQYEMRDGVPTTETYDTNVGGQAKTDPNLEIQYWDPTSGQWTPMPKGPGTMSQDNSGNSGPPPQPQLRVVDTGSYPPKAIAGAEKPGSMKTVENYDGTTTTYFDVNLGDGRDQADLFVTVRPQGSVSGATGLPPRLVQGRYVPVPVPAGRLVPETPVGHVTPTSTPNEIAPTLPTDAEAEQIKQHGEGAFLDVLASQPEGSNGKTLYNLLIARNLAKSGTYKGEVDLEQIEKDIQFYLGRPDVRKIALDTKFDVAQDVTGENPKIQAEEAAADLTSPETKAAVAAMPREQQDAFIKETTEKLALLDPGAAAFVQQELTVNLYKDVAIEDIASHINDLADSADAKIARGETPTVEEAEAKKAAEAAALDTFDTILTWRTSRTTVNHAAKAVKTWASSDPAKARKVMKQFTANMQNGMSPEQAMTQALESVGAPAHVHTYFKNVTATSGGLAMLATAGAAFSAMAVAQDAMKLADGENLTPQEKANFAADIMATMGGLSSTADNWLNTASAAHAASPKAKLDNYGAAQLHFHTEFDTLKGAHEAHEQNLAEQEVAHQNYGPAEEELAQAKSNYQELLDQGANPQELDAAGERLANASEAFDHANTRLSNADAAVGESGQFLQQQKARTQTALNGAKRAKKEAEAAIANDPISHKGSPILEEPLAPVPYDSDVGRPVTGPLDQELWEGLDHEAWRNPAAPGLAEAPSYARKAFAFKTLGLLGDGADLIYGGIAAKDAEEFAELGDWQDATAKGLQSAGLLGTGTAGIAGFGLELAGFEAAAAWTGPIGIGFGLVAGAGWAVEKAYEKHRNKVLEQKADKDFINSTGSGKEYAA